MVEEYNENMKYHLQQKLLKIKKADLWNYTKKTLSNILEGKLLILVSSGEKIVYHCFCNSFSTRAVVVN